MSKLLISFRNRYTMWKKQPKLPACSPLLPSPCLPLHPNPSPQQRYRYTGIRGISSGTEFNHFPNWSRLHWFMHINHICIYRFFSGFNTVIITEVAKLSVETRPWHKACGCKTLKTVELWFCSDPPALLPGTYKTTGFLPWLFLILLQ